MAVQLPPVTAPFFDDLAVGDVFDAPSLTLTSGLAAVHQAILGDRLRLALDDRLARAVTGQPSVAHPALVWDVAIGQSTVVTQRVVANLFYRGLSLHRMPAIGDTLCTTTEVVALRANRPKPDRRRTGLAALRIRCHDQESRPVIDFWRCAMLPVRDPAVAAARQDDLTNVGREPDGEAYRRAVATWDLAQFRAIPGTAFGDLKVGDEWRIDAGDVVSNATELARLTLNIAAAHHDAGSAGATDRLVYGGHTIGLALSQANRVLPNLVTITGWQGCEHLAPVHENDTLRSWVTVERMESLPVGGLVHLRSRVRAESRGAATRDVLDWRFVALMR